jgi:outer membrane protein OmpA-like peptidoglycan-associated protein
MYRINSKSLLLVLAVAGLAILPVGCKKQPPITLSASAAPPAVFPGEAVTVTATPGSVSTKKNNNLVYTWSGDGVKGDGTSATVATDTMEPGDHSVKVEVKEGKKGKEGLKPGQSADATASFTVKPFEPPTISCSASPTTIKPGESSTVTSSGVSPQNRPLTYTFSAAAGTISGSGNSATYSSTGAPTGPVDITCGVSDDKGHSASASTSVTIVAPPPPPQPHVETLCSVSFSTDARRPTRVNNEAKACLDEVALDLQKSSDAKAVLVGTADAKEQAKTEKQEKYAAKHKRAKVMNFAAQRAVNAKDYLVTEKGIDASRISVATGTEDSQSVQNYLVPAGANFSADVQGTTPVDESTMKVETRKALGERHHKKSM